MKSRLAAAFAGCCLAFPALAENPTLTLIVENVRMDRPGSQIYATLCAAEEFRADACGHVARAAPKAGKAVLTFADIPIGQRAIQVYHDENGNQQLDTWLFGIPAEGYAFGNNARGVMGPPAFEDAAVDVTGDMEVTIRMAY